jgi:hypothetical protein
MALSKAEVPCCNDSVYFPYVLDLLFSYSLQPLLGGIF